MPKCPYCTKELHIEDFFTKHVIKNWKGEIKKTKLGDFRGERRKWGGLGKPYHEIKMWSCPICETILGFSEYNYRS